MRSRVRRTGQRIPGMALGLRRRLCPDRGLRGCRRGRGRFGREGGGGELVCVWRVGPVCVKGGYRGGNWIVVRVCVLFRRT